MSTKKGTPAWIWIGCGCFLCVVLIIAAIGGLGFAGFSWVKNLVEDMADPQARTAATLDMLGAETLPAGYHARAFFNFPFIMQMAILSDGTPPERIEGEDFEEKAEQLENLMLHSDQMGTNTLFYLKLRNRNADDSIERVLAGKGRGNADIDLGVEFDISDSLGEGELQIGEQPATWRAYRGEMDTVGGEHEGIFTAVQFHCPSGDVHDVLWFQQAGGQAQNAGAVSETMSAEAQDAAEAPMVNMSESQALPIDPSDLEGTPADPKALTELLSYFKLCK